MNRYLNSLLLTLFVLTAVLPSCKYPTEYKAVNIENKFSMNGPPWVKEEDDLEPGAELQYANRFRNFYIICQSFNKADVKRAPSDIMHDNLNRLRTALKNPLVTDSADVSINGVNGLRAEIFGKMGKTDAEENIYYSEVVLEGKERFYHISVWTRGEDRKLRYKDDINKTISSFKEL